MNNADNLFDKVKKAAEARPFTVSAIEQLFGSALQLNETTSTAFFKVFRSSEGSNQNGKIDIELRIPAETSDKKDGMVILTLSDTPCNEKSDLPDWLGKGTMRPPNPNAPASLPLYTEHSLDWGTVSVGVSSGDDQCIRSVILNAI